MVDTIGFGRRGSVEIGSLTRLPTGSVYTATLSQQVLDLINSGGSGSGTINPSVGYTNVSGDFRGVSDSSYFAWDQGLDAIGFAKSPGFHGALAYAAGASGPMTLDIVEYLGQATINPDSGGTRAVRARWDNQGDFYQFQNTFLQGNASITGTLTQTGASTFGGSAAFNGGLTGTTGAFSTSTSAPVITQNGNRVIDTITASSSAQATNFTATKTTSSVALVFSTTPTFTTVTTTGLVSVGTSLSTGTTISAGSTVTAATGITATSGTITALNGQVVAKSATANTGYATLSPGLANVSGGIEFWQANGFRAGYIGGTGGTVTVNDTGAIPYVATGGHNFQGQITSDKDVIASSGTFGLNKGLKVVSGLYGVTATTGFTFLLNGTGTSLLDTAARFRITDGTNDIGRIHTTYIPIYGGGSYTGSPAKGYSGNTWNAGDIGTNTVYGTGNSENTTAGIARTSQLSGSGYGNLALFTVGTDNLVDGAITANKISLPAVASIVASGAGNNTTNSFFRFVWNGNPSYGGATAPGYVDPVTQQQQANIFTFNNGTFVTDPQAYQGYAVKIPSTQTSNTVGAYLINLPSLPAGTYNITVFLKVGANTNSTTQCVSFFPSINSGGTGTVAVTQGNFTGIYASQFSTTGYMGLSLCITVGSGGATNINLNVVTMNNVTDLYVSHMTGIPVTTPFNPYVSTVFTPNIFATSATISSVSATTLTAGYITSDNIFMGSGGHIYLGPTTLQPNGYPATPTTGTARIDISSGGISAFDATSNLYYGLGGPGLFGPAGQTFRLGADGTLRLKGEITAGSTITGAAFVAQAYTSNNGTGNQPGGSLAIYGPGTSPTNNALTMDTTNGFKISVESTTNLVTNPSFETGVVTGQYVNDNALTAKVTDTSRGFVGSTCLKLISNGGSDCYIEYQVNVTAGLGYSYSAYVLHPSGAYTQGANGGALFIYFPQASNVGASTSQATPALQWTRHKINNYITPAGCTYVRVRLYAPNSAGSGGTAYWDAVQVEQKPFVTRYCDGDQYGCTWAGTPHASQSTRTNGTVAVQLGLNDNDLFTGTILAGNIFGATISGSRFISYGQNSRLLLFDANGINQYNDSAVRTFYTDSDGNITATAGRIGGWSLTSSNILSSNSYVNICKDGYISINNSGRYAVMDGRPGQYVLYAGNSGGDTFFIDSIGNAYFKGAIQAGSTITGTSFMTADGGMILNNSGLEVYGFPTINMVETPYYPQFYSTNICSASAAYNASFSGDINSYGVAVTANGTTGDQYTFVRIRNDNATLGGTWWASVWIYPDTGTWCPQPALQGSGGYFANGGNLYLEGKTWTRVYWSFNGNVDHFVIRPPLNSDNGGDYRPGVAVYYSGFQWENNTYSNKGYTAYCDAYQPGCYTLANPLSYNGTGHARYGNVPIVKASGATGIKIAGVIQGSRIQGAQISGAAIFGTVITGSTIQTSLSGTRIVLTNGISGTQSGGDIDYLRFYSAGSTEAAPATMYAAQENGRQILVLLSGRANANSSPARMIMKSNYTGFPDNEIIVTATRIRCSGDVVSDSNLGGASLFLGNQQRIYFNGTTTVTDIAGASVQGLHITYNGTGAPTTNGGSVRLGTGGNVWVTNQSGNARAQFVAAEVNYTSLVNGSSIVLKKDVKDAEKGALTSIRQMRHVSFTRKDNEQYVHRGVIAEELQKYEPHLVQPMFDNDPTLGVELNGLVYLGLQATQELDADVAALRAEIADLRKQLAGKK